jgi:hypothetical protein
MVVSEEMPTVEGGGFKIQYQNDAKGWKN